MTKKAPNKNERRWCWWLHRYIYFTGKATSKGYIFTDTAGANLTITENQLEALKERP